MYVLVMNIARLVPNLTMLRSLKKDIHSDIDRRCIS